MATQIDQARINEIVGRRILPIARAKEISFPKLLAGNRFSWVTKSTRNYLLLVFASDSEMERIKGLRSRGMDPFPGLLTEREGSAAFRIDSAKNMHLQGNSVQNLFSISLGSDSTIVIENHAQRINVTELGPYEYRVELAYIASFGEEINQTTIYSYLEDVIAYSVNSWRQTNATK